MLSFNEEEEHEEAETLQVIKKPKFGGSGMGGSGLVGKNPDVNTHFLVDAERAEEAVALKKKLIEEYLEKQASAKAKEFVTTYQYWDGSHSAQ